MQTIRVRRIAGVAAAIACIVAMVAWTFAAWLRPQTLLAIVTGLSFCG
jgi:hypothetical protein